MCIFFALALSLDSFSNRQPKKGPPLSLVCIICIGTKQYLTATILASHRATMKCQTQFNSFNFFSIENEAKPIHLFPLIMRTIYYIKIFASLIRAKCLSIYFVFFMFFFLLVEMHIPIELK